MTTKPHYIGYPTRETADIIVDLIGDYPEDATCELISPSYPGPDKTEFTLEEAVKHIASFGFDPQLVHTLIVEYQGLCADTRRREIRGHITRPESFGSIYDD